MEKLLGEPAKAGEVQRGQIVWHEGEFMLVTEITDLIHEVTFNLMGENGGYRLTVNKRGQVMRGWRFLVGRKIG